MGIGLCMVSTLTDHDQNEHRAVRSPVVCEAQTAAHQGSLSPLDHRVDTDPASDADEVDNIFLEVGYHRHIQDGSGYRCAGIEPWKYQCGHAKKIMGHLRTLILWRGNLYSFFLHPQ